MTNAAILFTGNVCSTPMIEYARLCEDVFKPLIDIDQYNRALALIFGEGVTPLAPQSQPRLRKAGLEVSHCANAEEVLNTPKLKKFEGRYQAAVAELNNIFGGRLSQPSA